MRPCRPSGTGCSGAGSRPDQAAPAHVRRGARDMPARYARRSTVALARNDRGARAARPSSPRRTTAAPEQNDCRPRAERPWHPSRTTVALAQNNRRPRAGGDPSFDALPSRLRNEAPACAGATLWRSEHVLAPARRSEPRTRLRGAQKNARIARAFPDYCMASFGDGFGPALAQNFHHGASPDPLPPMKRLSG